MQALKNMMIQNEKLPGMKTISNWKLPSEDFSYGKKIIPDKEGVSISNLEINLVTRSWNLHKSTRIPQTQQDFIKVNKIGLKNNFTTHKSNSDFRRTISVSKSIYKGNLEKKIFLPDQDFSYGRKNKPSTPIKSVINFAFGNDAAQEMTRSYSQILSARSKTQKLVPKTTTLFAKRLELLNKENKNEIDNKKQQQFKIKKYINVNSKVIENLKNFKTFYPKSYDNDNMEMLINKVQKEIYDLDNQNH